MTLNIKGVETHPDVPIYDRSLLFEETNVGEALQRLNIVKQLPKLFEVDQKQCLARVLPLVQDLLKTEDAALHGEAAMAFVHLLTSKSVTPKDFTALFLPSILHYIDISNLGVMSIWVDVLLELVDQLPQETVNRKIYQLAWDKCQMSASPHQRAAAARLLGRMCKRFDQQGVSSEVWPLVQSLSQDVSALVRAMACQQLPLLAQTLPIDVVRREVLPCMIELAQDEEVSVRAEAVDTMVRLLPHLSVDQLTFSMLPLITSVCNRSKKSISETTVRLAANFSSLCQGLCSRGVLTTESLESLVEIYRELSCHRRFKNSNYSCSQDSSRLLVECRRLCADNLPGMFKLTLTAKTKRALTKTFTELVQDPSPAVRRNIAQTLHQMKELAGQSLRRGLLDLLRDPSEEVLSGVILHLCDTVDLLSVNGVFIGPYDPVRTDLASAILSAATTLNTSRNWRLVEQLYLQSGCAVKFLPSGYIYSHMYPRVLSKLLTARPLPVRHACTRTLLVYLRYNLKRQQRQVMLDRLQKELLYSDSCYQRMLYVTVCEQARDIFSADYFNANFLVPLLSLKDDSVINVRLALAEQIQSLHTVTEYDERGRAAVTAALADMLTREKDCDVVNALNIAKQAVQKDGMKLDVVENRKRLEEERKLSATSSNAIALPPHTRGSKNIKMWNTGIGGRTVKSRIFPSRSSGSTPLSTPGPSRSGIAMEVSWLNLELAMHRELRAFMPHNLRPLFSDEFERDFYRDAGVCAGDVLGPRRESAMPALLARTGRSKSFVLTPAPAPPITRIPISNRRSMDISQWSAKRDGRGQGDSSTNGISRLPVRKGRAS